MNWQDCPEDRFYASIVPQTNARSQPKTETEAPLQPAGDTGKQHQSRGSMQCGLSFFDADTDAMASSDEDADDWTRAPASSSSDRRKRSADGISADESFQQSTATGNNVRGLQSAAPETPPGAAVKRARTAAHDDRAEASASGRALQLNLTLPVVAGRRLPQFDFDNRPRGSSSATALAFDQRPTV